MVIGRFYYLEYSYCNFNRAEKTSSAHTAPKMSVGSSSKSTAKEGNLSLFSCLRSRKFTVAGGKQNNNYKDWWICFCSRPFGGRPVTVPEWRSTHSKESTTSVAKPTAFFLLCFLVLSRHSLLPILSFARSIMTIIIGCVFSNPIANILAYLYNKDRISFKSEGLFSILKYIFGPLTSQSVQIQSHDLSGKH